MKTGFEDLDKIINIGEPQLILLNGTYFIEEFSGDIANNVCIKQKGNVLEIVKCAKEYLIQRMIINEAKVGYKKWNYTDGYTYDDYEKIGQATVNFIKATKKIPTIIEHNIILYDLKKVTELISNYANYYADREEVNTLIVLDIFPLCKVQLKEAKSKDIKEKMKLIKKLKEISSKLKCTIIFLYDIDFEKECNQKDNIAKVEEINKYVDKFIITNIDKQSNIEEALFDINVYDKVEKIGTCKLKYDSKCRKFEDILVV